MWLGDSIRSSNWFPVVLVGNVDNHSFTPAIHHQIVQKLDYPLQKTQAHHFPTYLRF